MAHTETRRSIRAAMRRLLSRCREAIRLRGVRVTVRLDHDGPRANLIWQITNATATSVNVTNLVVRQRRRPTHTILVEPAALLSPSKQFVLATELDWNFLTARRLAVMDSAGREHAVPRRDVADVRERLRRLIQRAPDRRVSASDWLAGTADLAFGVVILGLGLFMLLWMIATG